jgi:hypothetical protein
MKNKKKKDLFLPFEISGNYFIEIINNREVVLTGSFEIIELDKTVLKINCGEKNIVFSGNDIEIAEYSFDGFKIKGDIKNIEFK